MFSPGMIVALFLAVIMAILPLILLAVTRPTKSDEPITPTRITCAIVSALCLTVILYHICSERERVVALLGLGLHAVAYILAILASLLRVKGLWTAAIVFGTASACWLLGSSYPQAVTNWKAPKVRGIPVGPGFGTARPGMESPVN